jgi:hypothetical protein
MQYFTRKEMGTVIPDMLFIHIPNVLEDFQKIMDPQESYEHSPAQHRSTAAPERQNARKSYK